jgi:hypothetical protein
MKRTTFVLIAGCLFLSALTGSMYAQANGNVFAYTHTRAFMPSVRFVALWQDLLGFDSAAAAGTKNIDLRANRDFSQRFSSAVAEQWYATPGGYMSYFKLDGFGGRAFYDKKGRWQASLICMGEAALPKDIRAVVKSTYYDYAITLAEDVETRSGGVYIVHLQDDKSIRIVRVTKEGEMETLQDIPRL